MRLQRLFVSLVVVVAAGGLCTIAACGSPDTVPDEPLTDQAAEDERTIVLYQYRFNPNQLQIEQGTTVVFENRDPETHNINIPALNIDRDIEPEERWTYTFDTEGEFAVSNRESERMRMDLDVEDLE